MKSRFFYSKYHIKSFSRGSATDLDHDLLREYLILWNALQSARINLEDTYKDVIVWTFEGSGQYLASSAYNIQFAVRSPRTSQNLDGESWHLHDAKFSFGYSYKIGSGQWLASNYAAEKTTTSARYVKEPRESHTSIHWISLLAKSLGSCSNLEQRSKLISIPLDDWEWYGRLVLPHDGSRYEDGTHVDSSDPMVYTETKKRNDLQRL